MAAMVDEKNIGKIFLGNVVMSPNMIESLSFDRILITSINEDDTAMEKLLKKGISRNKIVVLE